MSALFRLRHAVMLLALVACAVLSACGARPRDPAKMFVLPNDGLVYFAPDLRVGVARVDITPPPGLSLFGHGPEGRVSDGFRLRLGCKVILLTRDKEALVLVPCDLAAPSLHLQRAIVRRATDLGVPIRADEMLLMATHTHAGPAHYFRERRYAGAFSSYAPGYDEGVRDFLVERIAAGIKAAFDAREPACAGWGTDRVDDLTTNRSYVPFEANDHRPAAVNAPSAAAASEAVTAIDPTLSVLRIDRPEPGGACGRSGTPIAVFSVFGMHPTAIPNTNTLFHGDVFGFAVRSVESCLHHVTDASARLDPSCVADGKGIVPDAAAVAGIANGIEGDVSPRVDFQATREARRLGTALALRIVRARHVALPRREVELRHAYRELEWPNARVEQGRPERLCADPEIGTAAAAGARDGPTRFRIFPAMNAGVRLPSRMFDREHACHGPKLILVPPEGKPVGDGLQFPSVGPISIFGIGDGFITALPLEITTMAGLRLRDAVAKGLGKGKHFPVVGLTNAYLQYAATEEEYPYQAYEGASTLYGPFTARFLRAQAGCLAKWLVDGDDTTCRAEQSRHVNGVYPIASGDPLPKISRMPDEDEDSAVATPHVFDDLCVSLVGYPIDQGCARASPPAVLDGSKGYAIEWEGLPASSMMHRERMAVQVLLTEDARPFGGIVIDDDQGPNIELRRVGDRWRATWLPQLGEPGVDKRCGAFARIFVRGRMRLMSMPFEVKCGEPSAAVGRAKSAPSSRVP